MVFKPKHLARRAPSDGVYRISLLASELEVVVDGVELKPAPAGQRAECAVDQGFVPFTQASLHQPADNGGQHARDADVFDRRAIGAGEES